MWLKQSLLGNTFEDYLRSKQLTIKFQLKNTPESRCQTDQLADSKSGTKRRRSQTSHCRTSVPHTTAHTTHLRTLWLARQPGQGTCICLCPGRRCRPHPAPLQRTQDSMYSIALSFAFQHFIARVVVMVSWTMSCSWTCSSILEISCFLCRGMWSMGLRRRASAPIITDSEGPPLNLG